jgi:hypothetical protein
MKVAVFGLLFTMLLEVATLAQPQSLGPKDTLAAARLSPKEVTEIIAAVEQSAYDVPDSWTDELRARRINLGASPAIVVEGTKTLCGGTGNCQIFVLRQVNGHWLSLFGDQQAPIGESFEFGPGVARGVKDLTIITNLSAKSGKQITYTFDGKMYRTK